MQRGYAPGWRALHQVREDARSLQRGIEGEVHARLVLVLSLASVHCDREEAGGRPMMQCLTGHSSSPGLVIDSLQESLRSVIPRSRTQVEISPDRPGKPANEQSVRSRFVDAHRELGAPVFHGLDPTDILGSRLVEK